MLGGAGGSILSMILSLRNNKMLVRQRKSFREIREIYHNKLENRQLEFKEADEKYLKELRTELRKEFRLETIKVYSILILSIVIVFVCVFLLLAYLYKSDQLFTIKSEEWLKYEEHKSKRYNHKLFMYYGNHYLSKKEYDRAIIEYKGALKVFPDDINTKASLANVYYILCLEKDSLCNIAIEYYNELLKANDTSMVFLTFRSQLLMHMEEYEKANIDFDKIELLKSQFD